MAYSTLPTFASGTILPATTMGLIRADLEEVAKAPVGWAYSTTNQTVPNGTGPQLTLAATYALRNITFAASQLTVAEAGYYLITCHVAWGSSAAGVRSIQLLLNGTLQVEDHATPVVSNWSHQTLVAPLIVPAGGVLRANVFQDSGGNLAVITGSSLYCHMQSRL